MQHGLLTLFSFLERLQMQYFFTLFSNSNSYIVMLSMPDDFTNDPLSTVNQFPLFDIPINNKSYKNDSRNLDWNKDYLVNQVSY